jgi:hypothetical protein
MKTLKFKKTDWVRSLSIKEHKSFGHVGKVISPLVRRPAKGEREFLYDIEIQGKRYLLNEKELQRYPYIHKEISIGWVRLSFFKLGKMFTIRFEISKGWSK